MSWRKAATKAASSAAVCESILITEARALEEEALRERSRSRSLEQQLLREQQKNEAAKQKAASRSCEEPTLREQPRHHEEQAEGGETDDQRGPPSPARLIRPSSSPSPMSPRPLSPIWNPSAADSTNASER